MKNGLISTQYLSYYTIPELNNQFQIFISCHILRHLFTTRLCEAGVNAKSMQAALGHSDIRTTLQIYADVTEQHKQETFRGIEEFFKGIL